MSRPYINSIAQSNGSISAFGGLNETLRPDFGEWAVADNITTDDYPVISSRIPRRYFDQTGDSFCYIYNGFALCHEGTNINKVETESPGSVIKQYSGVTDSTKKMATLGDRVLIMPDKKYIDTNGSASTCQAIVVNYNSDYLVGNAYAGVAVMPYILGTGAMIMDSSEAGYNCYRGSSAPSDTSLFWYDTGNKELKKFNSLYDTWDEVESSYMYVEPYLYGTASPNETALAWLADIRSFMGSLNLYDTLNFNLSKTSSPTFSYDSDANIIEKVTNSDGDTIALVITGTADNVYRPAFFTIQRKCPAMEFICSHNNRVWGCNAYGTEIYASKLGDLTQWYSYAGLASDSYAATIGTGGNFTGICSYNGYMWFWKTDRVFRVAGNYPSNYTVTEILLDGVAEGFRNTLTVYGGVLYYVSTRGIMAFSGNQPHCISEQLGPYVAPSSGDERYCAGTYAGKLYVCLNCAVYVYDIERQLWSRMTTAIGGNVHVFRQLMRMPYNLNAYTGAYTMSLYEDYYSQYTETDVPWKLESGIIGATDYRQKYYSKIQIRAEFDGPWKVEVKYDDGNWSTVKEVTSTPATPKITSYTIPINARRCDHWYMRFSGTGEMYIYDINIAVEEGSQACN